MTTASPVVDQPSLFEQLGGQPAVEAAVDLFYRKVLTDGRVSAFFAHTDMDVQIAKQKAFLTVAFGGPNAYTGQDLRRGHRAMVAGGLTDMHFDAVLELLAESLRELGVAEPLVARVAAIAESTRNDVLNR